MIKFEKIVTEEKNNCQWVNLHLDGKYLVAVEESAFLLRKYIWPEIKILLKETKTVGLFLRAGFPLTSLPKVQKMAREAGLEEAEIDKQEQVQVSWARFKVPAVKKEEFEHWRSEIVTKKNVADKKLLPTYASLPAYKLTYDLFTAILTASRNFPKSLQFSLGQKMMEKIIGLNSQFQQLMRLKQDTKAQVEKIDSLLDGFNDLQFLFRLAFDQREVSLDLGIQVAEAIIGVKGQLGRWQNKIKKEGLNVKGK